MITQQDLLVRLQISQSYFGEMVNAYSNNRKYGRKCNLISLENIIILSVYISLLSCYDITKTNNCITVTQLTDMIDNISKLTGLKFQPYNFTYS